MLTVEYFMELKDLLGENYKDGITIDEINAALASKKLADLSTGDYVSKAKFTKAESDYNAMKKELDELKAANMTDEQKRQAEQDKILNEIKEKDEKIAKFEKKEQILKSGFTTDECEQIMSSDNQVEAYSKIMQARVDDAVKKAEAKVIKAGSTLPNDGKGKSEDYDINNYSMEEMNKMQIDNPEKYKKIINS